MNLQTAQTHMRRLASGRLLYSKVDKLAASGHDAVMQFNNGTGIFRMVNMCFD